MRPASGAGSASGAGLFFPDERKNAMSADANSGLASVVM
jgi:hypothetical protein